MKRQFTLTLAVILLVCECVCSAGSEENQAGNALPARYDMRDDGIVTPVKLQYPWTCCWGFAATAAAETSILSAMGKTYDEFPIDLSERHAIWFVRHPAEPEKTAESKETESLSSVQKRTFNQGGEPSRVGTLFAMGAGPVEESAYPYHGREMTPEAYVAMKEPEKWIENYKQMNTKHEMEEEEAKNALKKKQAEIESGYNLLWYSGDDWTLSETDENGNSVRMQRSRWLLKDDNKLPPLVVPSNSEDEDSVRVPNEAGILAAKQEMLNGHAVITSYRAESFSPAGENPDLLINYSNWAQYSYESTGVGHAICIVGWDDNFPAEAFSHEVHMIDKNGNRTVDEERTKKTTPPGNGAWLIKNSRGSETDAIPDGMTDKDGNKYPENRNNFGIVNAEGKHTGYNWISYYDQYLNDAVETFAFTVEPEGKRSRILQYDFMTSPFNVYFEQQSEQPVSCANVFMADQDMTLTGVSARTVHDNSRVTFCIVKLNENAGNPEDGEEILRFSANFRYFGYHRTALETPIELKSGDRFSVMTTTDYLDNDGRRVWEYSVMTTTAESEHQMAANPGESFVKENGKWQDWTEKEKPVDEFEMLLGEESITKVYDNFSIKVFCAQ